MRHWRKALVEAQQAKAKCGAARKRAAILDFRPFENLHFWVQPIGLAYNSNIWHHFWRDWILFSTVEIYSWSFPGHMIFKFEEEHENVIWKWESLGFALRDPRTSEKEESASHHSSIICFCAAARRNGWKWCRESPEMTPNHQKSDFWDTLKNNILQLFPHLSTSLVSF